MSFLKKFKPKPKPTPRPPFYDIVCPFCFEKFSPDKVVFRAANSNPEDHMEDEKLNNYRSKFNLDRLSDLPPIIDPKTVPMEFHTIVDGVLTEIKVNGETTNKRLCPECHNELPVTAGRTPSNIISMVGASQVGKSVYMATLIHTLQNITANNFDAACMPVNVEISRRYREDYEDPIYDRGITISATQKTVKQEPLIFQFKFRDESKPPVMMVFFDAAGEGMTDQEYLDIFGAHIRNSSGIMFLVDPEQIKSIRSRIAIKKGEAEGDFTRLYEEPREVVISLFENFIGNQEKGKTDIPTAIVLTKSDMLKYLTDSDYIKENSNVFNNPIHRGVLNLIEFENINGEVREFLSKVDRAFIDAVDVHFSNTGFFAVSALGSNPIDNKIQGVINSIRVDEPFLWLLHKLNYIEAR